MKNLLNKEHSCYKIHIHITNEKQCLPFFYRQPPLYGLSPFFTRKFWPPLLWFFRNSNPPINKRGFTANSKMLVCKDIYPGKSLNKDTPLQVKWKSNKNLKAIEIIFLMNIYTMIGSDSRKSKYFALECPKML